MKRRFLFSVAFAGVVAVATGLYLRHERKSIQEHYTMTSVLEARRYVPKGQKISEDYVKEVAIPVAYLQPTALQKKEEIKNDRGEFFLKSRINLLKGEQLTRSKLYEESHQLGLAWAVPQGLSAVTLELSPAQATGGMIQPGDWVHVLAAFGPQPGWPEPRSRLTLRKIRVLAVQNRIWDPAAPSLKKIEWEDFESQIFYITLGVTPFQAAALSLAEARGKLKLALVSPMDKTLPKRVDVDLNRLKKGY